MIKINNLKLRFIIILCFAFITLINAQEQQKIAQSGFMFLSVVSDARGAALANAVTTLNMKSSSLFFNPATLTEMTQMIEISGSFNEYIAGIKHNTFSLSYNPANGLYGVLGVSIQTVDYGDNFFGTIVWPNDQGYIDTGDLNPTATAIGVGYAKSLSDKFSVGAQIRWTEQNFGTITEPEMLQVPVEGSEELKDSLITVKNKYSQSPFAYDFGTIYKTGFKSLIFGMSIRNFSGEVKYIRETFQLPMVFTLGIHMDLIDFIDEGSKFHQALFMFNTSHYRSHPEEYQFGLEYTLMQILSLRGGYIQGRDEEGLTFGVGVNYKEYLTFDYAYTPYGLFDKVARYTVRFAF